MLIPQSQPVDWAKMYPNHSAASINGALSMLARQGFQTAAPQPAMPPAARPAMPGASTRPAGVRAAPTVQENSQKQWQAYQAWRQQSGEANYEASRRAATEAQSLLVGMRPSLDQYGKPNRAQQKLVDDYLAKISRWNPSVADRAREQWLVKAAAAQGSGAGSGYTAPGFQDPQPSATSSKPFDRYYGYGDKETWQAHGSPKGGRPGQARPSPQTSQGRPYGTDATGQTASNDARWGRGQWAYARTQPSAPAAPAGPNAQPGSDALQTIAQRQSQGRPSATPLAGLTQQQAEPAYTPFTGRKWWQTTSKPGVYR